MSNQIHNPEHHNIQDYAKYININNTMYTNGDDHYSNNIDQISLDHNKE